MKLHIFFILSFSFFTINSVANISETQEDNVLRAETKIFQTDFCKTMSNMPDYVLENILHKENKAYCGENAIDLDTAPILTVARLQFQLFYTTADLNGNGLLTSDEQGQFFKVMYLPSSLAYYIFNEKR